MPQVFKIGSYWVYFWTNEGKPLEPLHVHVSEGSPSWNATKIWITSTGKAYLCNNNSRIPEHHLRNIMRMVEARNEEIMHMWKEYFGEIQFYCYYLFDSIVWYYLMSENGKRRTELRLSLSKS